MNPLTKILNRPLTAALAASVAFCVPAAIVLPATPVAAQAASSDLDRAIRALRGITTLRADFTQTDRNGQVIGGELTLKSPGKIRFEYSDDVNMLIVSNGSALSVVDYDVQQVERYPVGDSPLGALLDPDKDLRRFGSVQRSTNPNVISVAVADPGKPEFPTITLIFVRKASAPGGLELASWVALDSQNNRTTVRLLNHRYGLSVPNSAFTFRDPRQGSRRPG